MKKYFYLLAMLAVVLGTTACSDDDNHPGIAENGITYILQNNVWGTNFPLWYEENARFIFRITEE